MKKILLFGATGHLGRAIAAELHRRGYSTRAVVRNAARAAFLQPYVAELVEGEVTRPGTLQSEYFAGVDVVVSALGKSVSLNDRSRATFREVDYHGNRNVLELAKRHGVKKFIYVSAFQAENYPNLEYFRVHADFARDVAASGLEYCIAKPPALFSAFLEMLPLARQGRLMGIGSGQNRTNPIDEADFARVVCDQIEGTEKEVAAGGKTVYRRAEILDVIQAASGREAKIRSMPLGVVKFLLPFLRLVDRNLYDKLAFFVAVMQEDVLAPPVGPNTLEDYLLAAGKNVMLPAEKTR